MAVLGGCVWPKLVWFLFEMKLLVCKYDDGVSSLNAWRSRVLFTYYLKMFNIAAIETIFVKASIKGKVLTFRIARCEDLLLKGISSSNIVGMLGWASQPHGSLWLRRQIIRSIRDNFAQVRKLYKVSICVQSSLQLPVEVSMNPSNLCKISQHDRNFLPTSYHCDAVWIGSEAKKVVWRKS